MYLYYQGISIYFSEAQSLCSAVLKNMCRVCTQDSQILPLCTIAYHDNN